MTTYYVAVDYDDYDIGASSRLLPVVGTSQDEVLAEATDRYPLTECIIAEPCSEVLYEEIIDLGVPLSWHFDEKTGTHFTTHEAHEREMAEAIVWKI